MKIFSVVGTGPSGQKDYDEVLYDYRGHRVKTKYAVIAAYSFMKDIHHQEEIVIYLICTKESDEMFSSIKEELIEEYDVASTDVKKVRVPDLDEFGPETLRKTLMPYVEINDDICLEITHGFKSFSLSVMDFVQYAIELRDVEVTDILYMPYNREKSGKLVVVSNYRFLIASQRLLQALNLFKRTLQGSYLAETIKNEKLDHLDKAIQATIEKLVNLEKNILTLRFNDQEKLAGLEDFVRSFRALPQQYENITDQLVHEMLGQIHEKLSVLAAYDAYDFKAEFPFFLFEHRLYVHGLVYAYETIRRTLSEYVGLKETIAKKVKKTEDITSYNIHQTMIAVLLKNPGSYHTFLTEEDARSVRKQLKDIFSLDEYEYWFKVLRNRRNNITHGNIENPQTPDTFMEGGEDVKNACFQLKKIYQRLKELHNHT